MLPVVMHGGGDEVDLAPMVDIAFLLLTFFMMTTVFKTSDDAKLELPKSSSDKKEPAEDFITVSISDSTTNNRIVINMYDQKVRTEVLTRQESLGLSREEALQTKGFEVKGKDIEDVKKKLANTLIFARQIEQKQRIIFNADKGVKFGLVQDVMGMMKKANFVDVELRTTMER